jgi:hypothetical protein
VKGVFRDRVSWVICQVYLQTMILLFSASWVARVIGVSHWCLAISLILEIALVLLLGLKSNSSYSSHKRPIKSLRRQGVETRKLTLLEKLGR